MITSAQVYAQINGGETSTRQWCENKKDRVTDLMLVFFAPSTSTMTIGDFRDNGNVLVAETAEKMILTGQSGMQITSLRKCDKC